MRFTLIFFLFAKSILANPGDSIKKKPFHLLASIGYNIGLGQAIDNGHQFVTDDNGKFYEFDRKSYDFKTPAVGIGCLVEFGKIFFVKADLAYIYSVRHFSEHFESSARTDNGTIMAQYFEPYITQSYSVTHSVGEKYYRCSDDVNVDLRTNYINLNVLFGIKINRNFAFVAGFRSNILGSYSYKGRIDRTANEYMITSFNNTNWGFKDSLIESHPLSYTTKSELRSKIDQQIGGSFYWNLGFNYTYYLKQGGIMFDLIYDSQKNRQWYVVRDYLTLKLSYIF